MQTKMRQNSVTILNGTKVFANVFTTNVIVNELKTYIIEFSFKWLNIKIVKLIKAGNVRSKWPFFQCRIQFGESMLAGHIL